ncbi:uncharacterized protein UTRI_04170 [Ustilago trichophora]|uniref:Uncharacterized protein n=1 Tax=Ustilago trichophora TaxID=86804 RepID=A0A5C3EAE1_9BASI|nr:uncharacterized protein UTRI_04170 [Ustilago trichophora]
MKGSKLLLQPASKPCLRALVQASSRPAHGAIPISCYHVRSTKLRSLPHSYASCSGSVESRWKSCLYFDTHVDEHRSLLLSESPNDPGSPQTPHKRGQGISDHEYQTRVGKACRVLVDSLPDFMAKGVVDLDDLEPDCQASVSGKRSGWSAKGLLPNLSPFLGQSLLRRSTWTPKGKAKATEDEADAFDSLYHPSIAFEFRPPLPHISIGKKDGPDADRSPPKSNGVPSSTSGRDSSGTSLESYDEHSRGGPTICFNGRTMYVASSHLLRHALSALFHDTSLHLESARFEGLSKAGSSWPGISPYIRRSCTQNSAPSDESGSWQDKLVIRLRFEGISRVSSQPHTYTVIFKYEFDRSTGMIARHVVDNIQPVPGSKVWAGLSSAWGTLSPAGAAGGGAATGGGSTACSSKMTGRGV